MALLAIDLDVPGGLFDKTVDHAQPKAGALAGSLRREEGVEYLVDNGGRNARSGVAYGHQDVVAGPNVAVTHAHAAGSRRRASGRLAT